MKNASNETTELSITIDIQMEHSTKNSNNCNKQPGYLSNKSFCRQKQILKFQSS